jgi:hypothetical protein
MTLTLGCPPDLPADVRVARQSVSRRIPQKKEIRDKYRFLFFGQLPKMSMLNDSGSRFDLSRDGIMEGSRFPGM